MKSMPRIEESRKRKAEGGPSYGKKSKTDPSVRYYYFLIFILPVRFPHIKPCLPEVNCFRMVSARRFYTMIHSYFSTNTSKHCTTLLLWFIFIDKSSLSLLLDVLSYISVSRSTYFHLSECANCQQSSFDRRVHYCCRYACLIAVCRQVPFSTTMMRA